MFAVSFTQLEIRILKPQHDGGAKILRFVIESKLFNSDTWKNQGEYPSYSVMIKGLPEGRYEFRVRARNKYGVGVPDEIKSITLVIGDSPQITIQSGPGVEGPKRSILDEGYFPQFDLSNLQQFNKISKVVIPLRIRE